MQKRSYPYRVLALLLAALMLTTSVSLAVDMHFCRGELKSVSLFGKAKTCHDAMAQQPCPHHQTLAKAVGESTVAKRKCCHNKTVYVQADLDQTVVASDPLVLKPHPSTVPFPARLWNTLPIATEPPVQIHYKPPILWRNRPVLHQSFLL